MKYLIKETSGISCPINYNFSKTYIGHVLHKNSLDIKKREPFEIVRIKCIKIGSKKNLLQ